MAAPEEAEVAAAIESWDAPASAMHGNAGAESSGSRLSLARAVRLRVAGMTYDQIAEQAGYSDKGAARNAVMRALDRHEAAQVADLRAEENARLDRAQAAIWTKVLAGDLRAVDTFVRLSARRARMNGLDAPQQVQISSGAQAALADALADLRAVVGGEVLAVTYDDEDPDDYWTDGTD